MYTRVVVSQADDRAVGEPPATERVYREVGQKPDSSKKILGRILEAQHAVLLLLVSRSAAAKRDELENLNDTVRSELDLYWRLK